MKRKKSYKSTEEREILMALEKGTLKRSRNAKKEIALARAAAEHYGNKAARINIRISDFDLLMLKRRAENEGLPYQTLISSVLHKFVTGQLA